MSSAFFAYNGPTVTSAAPVKVATGTAIKTMMQLASSATVGMTIVEWGVSFDGTSSAAVPIEVELIDASIAATVTAYVAADLVHWSDPTGPATLAQIGSTTLSGYTATAEGTFGTSRQLGLQLVSPTGGFVEQFPLGREPAISVSRFVRIRMTAAATVNAYCYIVWQDI